MDERIQMHADMLFHRMLDQKAAIEKAKAEGRPAPTFAPLIEPAAGPDDSETAPAPLSPADHKSWMEKLQKLPAEERQAEEEAMKAELRAKAEFRLQGEDAVGGAQEPDGSGAHRRRAPGRLLLPWGRKPSGAEPRPEDQQR